MSALGDWLEQKGYNLIIVAIIVQIFVCVLFTILFIVSDNNHLTIPFIIYVILTLVLFMAFMIHFAVHSIKNAYVVELIAFLVMSTLSSLFNAYCYYHYIFDKFDDNKVLFNVIAIICISLLGLGNIVYFISAYFTYHLFEEKAILKLGAKPIMHKMFTYVQFHHSLLKLDLGLTLFLYLTLTFVFYEDIANMVISCVCLSVMIVIVVWCKRVIRSEEKAKVLILVGIRNALEIYRIYRTIALAVADFENHATLDQRLHFGTVVIYIGSGINLVVFVIIDVLTYLCINNFDKGLKTMLISQREIDLAVNSDSELASSKDSLN